MHSRSIGNVGAMPTIKQKFDLLQKNIELPLELLNMSESLWEKALNFNSKQVILHKDLHYDNIIKRNNEWVAIDAKGYIGDIINEAAF